VDRKRECSKKINIPEKFYNITPAVVESLAEHPALAHNNETERQKTQQLFDKARESLTVTKKALLQALWYSAETVARAGAAAGTLALTAAHAVTSAHAVAGAAAVVGAISGAVCWCC